MKHTLVVRSSVAFLCLGLAASVSAQVVTTAELKAACQAPGNTVNVVNTYKVMSPVQPPPLVVVNSGCTFVFAPDSQFETDNVNLRFTGPVSFQASAKATVSFKSTAWTAPSFTASLLGNEGGFYSDESRVTANAGGISIALGDFATLGITGPINGVGNALNAVGTLGVSAGQKFTGTFETTRVRGGTGISMALNGSEATVAGNNTNFIAAAGQFNLSSPGVKASVDLASGVVQAPGGVALTLPGAESKATILGTRLTAVSGSVSVQAGSAGQGIGVVTIDSANIRAGGSYTMLASVGADKGEAVLSNSSVTAGGNVLIRSDLVGLTNILNNVMTSPTEIRAFTGASGACIAEGNNATAPVVAICQ